MVIALRIVLQRAAEARRENAASFRDFFRDLDP